LFYTLLISLLLISIIFWSPLFNDVVSIELLYIYIASLSGWLYGAVDGIETGWENKLTRRNPAPMTLCPPQILHVLPWDRSNPVRHSKKPVNNCLTVFNEATLERSLIFHVLNPMSIFLLMRSSDKNKSPIFLSLKLRCLIWLSIKHYSLEAAVLVLLMRGIYEVSRWDGLRWRDVHTECDKYWFRPSKVVRENTHAGTHTTRWSYTPACIVSYYV
jgi:hypothetical protein